MAFEDFSKIETFRRKFLGEASRLKLLGEDPSGNGYFLLGELSTRFYVTRGGLDTAIGEYRAKMVFDKPDAVTNSDLSKLLFVDLVLNESLTRRYRIASETPPTTMGNRWYYSLSGAFNDNTPLVD